MHIAVIEIRNYKMRDPCVTRASMSTARSRLQADESTETDCLPGAIVSPTLRGRPLSSQSTRSVVCDGSLHHGVRV